MNITSLPAILDIVATGGISAGISALLVLLAPVVSAVPGFRPSDGTRSTLLRILLYLLNVAAILALAWSQNIVIEKSALPALLIAAAGGGSSFAHLLYTGIKKANVSKQPALALATDALQTAQALGK